MILTALAVATLLAGQLHPSAGLVCRDRRRARAFAANPHRSLPLLKAKFAPVAAPDAAKLLEAWAGGAAGARLTAEAKAALARLKR